MYLRCTTCHAAVWVGRPAQGDAVTAACRQCKQTYELDPGLTRSQDKIDEAARDLARDEQVDLPGAYSILFGLMTLEELKDTHDPKAIEADDRSEPAQQAEISYDPGFADAVRAGQLTPAQARQRGDREAFAGKLISRHSLPRETALAIADNRISLLAAIRGREAGETLRVAAPAPDPPIARPLATVALVVGLVLVAFVGYQRVTQTRGASTDPPFTIERDHAGRVVQVDADEARLVLDSYCEAVSCIALDLMPSTTPNASPRLGVLIASEEDEDDPPLLAIEIRRDGRSGRWRAGDGLGRLEAIAAPQAADEFFRQGSSPD